jgi:hypothetical protein
MSGRCYDFLELEALWFQRGYGSSGRAFAALLTRENDLAFQIRDRKTSKRSRFRSRKKELETLLTLYIQFICTRSRRSLSLALVCLSNYVPVYLSGSFSADDKYDDD